MAMNYRINYEDMPDLPGYWTVARVSAEYGMSKEGVRNMVWAQKLFPGACKVTWGEPGDPNPKIILLLPEQEVRKVFARRTAAREQGPSLAKQINAWNRRVKDWGRVNSWAQTPIRVSGAPHKLLAEAYLEANPADPRPSDGAALASSAG